MKVVDSSPFRQDHRDIVELVAQLEGLLDAESLSVDASQAHELLGVLATRLVTHLAREDEVVYPQLITHKVETVRAMAQLLKKRVGGLDRTFRSYVDDWSSPSLVENSPKKFIAETKGLLRVLKMRIKREDEELYPLVDRYTA